MLLFFFIMMAFASRFQKETSATFSIRKFYLIFKVNLIVIIFFMLKLNCLRFWVICWVELIFHFWEHLIVNFHKEVKIFSKFDIKNRPNTNSKSHNIPFLSKRLFIPLFFIISKRSTLILECNNNMIPILNPRFYIINPTSTKTFEFSYNITYLGCGCVLSSLIMYDGM